MCPVRLAAHSSHKLREIRRAATTTSMVMFLVFGNPSCPRIVAPNSAPIALLNCITLGMLLGYSLLPIRYCLVQIALSRQLSRSPPSRRTGGRVHRIASSTSRLLSALIVHLSVWMRFAHASASNTQCQERAGFFSRYYRASLLLAVFAGLASPSAVRVVCCSAVSGRNSAGPSRIVLTNAST
jgi:hypothetical protein